APAPGTDVSGRPGAKAIRRAGARRHHEDPGRVPGGRRQQHAVGRADAQQAIEIDGHPPPDPRNPPIVDFRTATQAYFSAERIPIRRGRDFAEADREDAAPVVIVSESMAQKFWPNEDPVGRRMRVQDGEWMTVVGVSGDVIHDWFNRHNAPTMYVPF